MGMNRDIDHHYLDQYLGVLTDYEEIEYPEKETLSVHLLRSIAAWRVMPRHVINYLSGVRPSGYFDEVVSDLIKRGWVRSIGKIKRNQGPGIEPEPFAAPPVSQVIKKLRTGPSPEEKYDIILDSIGLDYGSNLNAVTRAGVHAAARAGIPFFKGMRPLSLRSSGVPKSVLRLTLEKKQCFLSRHTYMIAITSARLVYLMRIFGIKDVAVYPEEILRGTMGWYRVAHALKTSDRPKNEYYEPREYFHTSVPDAWFVTPKKSFRLEFQLSKQTTERFRDVLKGVPEESGEMVVYVGMSRYKAIFDSIERRVEVLASEGARVMLVDYDEKDWTSPYHLSEVVKRIWLDEDYHQTITPELELYGQSRYMRTMTYKKTKKFMSRAMLPLKKKSKK